MNSRSQVSRPPIERMMRIHEELKRGAFTNCTQLTEKLAVSRKTIVRDIGFMRDRLELPIEFDPRLNAYRYAHPVSAFPTVQVSEGELLALLVARKALEQYRGTPFHRQLEVSFEKLTAGLKDRISFSPANELRSVSFKNVGLGKADMEVFNILSRSTLRENEVEFDYRKPGETKPARRRVQPYHLANRENLWYLIGFAPRTFALPRISRPLALPAKFTRPADFSPEKFFASALGVLGGEGNYHVVIRFRSAVADRVREREWHESQELRDLPDGGLEVSLRLGALPEVERWVLTWAGDAEVIAPRELRRRMKVTAAALQKLYRSA
jgi:proteasome accessory factor B